MTLISACSSSGKKKEDKEPTPIPTPSESTTPTPSEEITPSIEITPSSPTPSEVTPTIEEVSPTPSEEPVKEEKVLTMNFYTEDTSDNDVLTYAFDQQSNCEKFIEDQNNILTSVSCIGYAQINYVGNKGDADRFAVMIIGSSKTEGELTFTTNAEIVDIAVSVRAYTKYYSSAWHPDTTTFYLDDVEQQLNGEETKETELVNVEKHYDDPVKSFKIGTKDKRAFVHTISITYYE